MDYEDINKEILIKILREKDDIEMYKKKIKKRRNFKDKCINNV